MDHRTTSQEGTSTVFGLDTKSVVIGVLIGAIVVPRITGMIAGRGSKVKAAS